MLIRPLRRLRFEDTPKHLERNETRLYGMTRFEQREKAIRFLQNRIAAFELGERSADDQTMVVCSIE